MNDLLYRLRWWRFQAWFFGGLSSGLERLHRKLHPTPPNYRCQMCEEIKDGWP